MSGHKAPRWIDTWRRCATVSALASAPLACGQRPSPADQVAEAIAPIAHPELSLRPSAAVQPPASPRRERAKPAVDDTSQSLGPTGGGRLLDATPLPADVPALRATVGATRKGASFGHHSLIAALRRAALSVQIVYPDSVLFVGDISRPEGGAFPPHASHTNGRDVDLAFFVETTDGVDRDEGAMTRVLADGTVVGSDRVFDRARNWALIERLIQDPSIQIQWIFVAAEVKILLLDHARAINADAKTIERATRLLLQPRDSSPHNDHFHVRIYCDRDDRLRGCVDAAPFHPWVDDHSAALKTWLAGVQPFFALPGTTEYRWALEQVALNHVREAIPVLEALPIPPTPEDASLREDVLNHLRDRRASTDRWQALRPIDGPP